MWPLLASNYTQDIGMIIRPDFKFDNALFSFFDLNIFELFYQKSLKPKYLWENCYVCFPTL